ncbi:MAG: glutathione S-transferase, partial [Rhodobacteraceae bacterium]|nr:glutathione S-transferase [Paracoccaceae bacterium]
PTSDGRADFYRWMFFAAGPLEAALVNRALGVEVPEERRGMVGYAKLERMFDALEGAVAGREFIAGSRFSAADVYVGS